MIKNASAAESKYRFPSVRNPYAHRNGKAILFTGIRIRYHRASTSHGGPAETGTDRWADRSLPGPDRNPEEAQHLSQIQRGPKALRKTLCRPNSGRGVRRGPQ